MILSMYPFQIMCVCFITQVGKALSQIEQIVNMMSVTYLQLTFTCLHHKMLENLYFPFLKYHTPDRNSMRSQMEDNQFINNYEVWSRSTT